MLLIEQIHMQMKDLLKIFIILIIVYGSLFAANESKSDEVAVHTGRYIPLNLYFNDSEGKKVQLQSIIDKPTVIDFAYYRCTGICTPLMTEISDVIGKVDLTPGKDYNIVCVSIDKNETSAIAAQKKHELIGLVTRRINPSAWRFLTGDSLTIKELTDAAGFHFYRSGNIIIHKGVLIFVDKNGKICSYLQPGYDRQGDFSILPSDFQMSVIDASKGNLTSGVLGALQTCLGIKKGNLYVFFAIFITGIFTIGTTILIIKKAKPAKRQVKV